MSIKKIIYSAMVCLALLSVISTGLMFSLLDQNQSNGKIVNYCGVVRGASQRVMKLHLMGQPVEEAVAKVEKAMDGLISGSQELGLPKPGDEKLVSQMQEIRTYWKEQVLPLLTEDPEQKLLENSEELFNKSNSAVSQAEKYSAQGIIRLKVVTVITLVVNLAFIAFIFVVIRSKVLLPIKVLEKGMENLSQGDLQTEIAYSSTNELGMLANSMRTSIQILSEYISRIGSAMEQMEQGNFDLPLQQYIGDFTKIGISMEKFSTQISEILMQLNVTSEQVSAGSDHVASSSQLLAEGAAEQSAAIEQLSQAVGEIVEKIDYTTENARRFNDKAQKMGASLDESERKMWLLLKAMDDIRSNSEEIIKINKTIEDIAFQTNILALNAAVEAARAGEAGKGFAVVADEVRNLAAKSALAASNTSELIDVSVRSVETGKELTDSMAQTMSDVLKDAREIALGIGDIQTASQEQSLSISNITINVDQISSVIQSNSATAQESAAASEELSAQARLLSNLAGQFTLKQNRGF
ncbi:MAG: methyl-accepting chemotaxis protein [Lacrimispora sp.]|uniref:methyl-accepting chemotaxis protein n=1 Tax=Lacrimispora sp. TaxID=2719234 RepID=UPI0039E4BF1C